MPILGRGKRSSGRLGIIGGLVAAAGLLLSSAQADDISTIDQGAFVGAQGIVQANIVAGEGNVEINAASILQGDGEARTHSGVTIEQADSQLKTSTIGQHTAAIRNEAFQNASGLIMVNVAAGANNQLANATSIISAGSLKPVSDTALSQGRAPTGSGTNAHSNTASRDKATVDDTAFSGASGVIQVTVVGGSGNRLANELALNVGVGARP